MHAAQLGKLLAALRQGAGSHWKKASHTSYRVGPDKHADVIIYEDGRLQTKSHLGAQLLAEAHVAVQCPTLRGGKFSYYSLQSGRQVSFTLKVLEFLRPLDPNFEGLPLGLIKSPEFSDLPKGLVVTSKKPSESDYAILTAEACDGIRLLTAFLEIQNRR